MEQIVIAGRRETVHRVVGDGIRATFGTVRCNLDLTDEEWAPRAVAASEVPAGAHRCGHCFPQSGVRR